MKETAPLNVDFAALRTLRMVYESGSFSRTAERLGLNQSAVSYTIEKLRRVFKDPLFFRQGGRLVATDRCHQLHDAADNLLSKFEAVVSPSEFDPATSEDKVVLACNFYERQLILPPVLQRMRAIAPNMRIETITSTSQGHIQLQRNEADLLIGPLKPNDNGFHSTHLFKERYVCVMDPQNPLGHSPLTMDAYISASHAIVLYGGGWRSEYLKKLDALGLKLNQVLNLPSPAGLDRILPGTDVISTVASRIATSFARDLRIVECPYTAEFDLSLVWTTRTHASPKHVWFRQLVLDEATTRLAELGEPNSQEHK